MTLIDLDPELRKVQKISPWADGYTHDIVDLHAASGHIGTIHKERRKIDVKIAASLWHL